MSSTPPPLALSDEQITTVMQLARPLPPEQRVQFLEMVAARLNGKRDVGDGAIYQLCRELQRELFSPPDLGNNNHVGKYARPLSRATRPQPPLRAEFGACASCW